MVVDQTDPQGWRLQLQVQPGISRCSSSLGTSQAPARATVAILGWPVLLSSRCSQGIPGWPLRL